ncbi:hypothetical protein A6A06_15145 [Streptomyces sp. CB02923]|uniref:hypothetical protein n=1 Tax=Streptomyces sp. CB02923 TaxID=1718985 RepID=UPI00093B3C81|nr:hypothetical protein [Streptomyces sp. CB02923]OKI02377.1 hypothetical protein A6A06_15145 [Streptomyces sp. CB02923]
MTVLLAAALIAPPAPQATAGGSRGGADGGFRTGVAAGCQTRADARHTDWTGMNFLGDVVCPHNLGAIRVQSTPQSTVNGQIAFAPSWFVCWKKGGSYQGKDIWYYTQADTVSGSKGAKGWGYLPAAEMQVSGHPVAGLKKCTWA